MSQSAEPPFQGDCLEELERRLSCEAAAAKLGDSVVRLLQQWNGRWYSTGERRALSQGARGPLYEVLQMMKSQVAAGTNRFDDLAGARSYLVTRAAALLYRETSPREFPDTDGLACLDEVLAIVLPEDAQVHSEYCPEALAHALKSCSGGAGIERIAKELAAAFAIHITPPCLAVQIAMAIRYFVAEQPDSSAAKRLRKVRKTAHDRLAPHLSEYFRVSGLNDTNVRIAVGIALGESPIEAAGDLGIAVGSIRSRRSRLRTSSDVVRSTFPVQPLRPELGRC